MRIVSWQFQRSPCLFFFDMDLKLVRPLWKCVISGNFRRHCKQAGGKGNCATRHLLVIFNLIHVHNSLFHLHVTVPSKITCYSYWSIALKTLTKTRPFKLLSFAGLLWYLFRNLKKSQKRAARRCDARSWHSFLVRSATWISIIQQFRNVHRILQRSFWGHIYCKH